jgi:hypothetical protein
LRHLLFVAALALAGCAAVAEPVAQPAPAKVADAQSVPKPTAGDIRMLAVMTSYLPGTYESIAQDKGPGVGVRMRIAPFWTERSKDGEFWFYVEQSRVGEDDKPFQQRIYRFTGARHRFRADVFGLPGEPARFVNEWRKPKPFDAVGPGDLRAFPACAMPIGTMTAMFWAHTQGVDCRAENPTVAYERTDLFASSVGMKLGTFGFDPAGRQIAGEAGPWDFRRFTAELR